MTVADTTSQIVIEPVDRTAWEAWSREFADHNYRQTWSYGTELAQRQKAMSEHVAIRADGELIGLANVRIKRVPIIGGGLAYISGGPLTRRGDENDLERLSQCLQALREEFVDRRGLMLRILGSLGSAAWNAAAAGVFESVGFLRSVTKPTYRTLVLDVSKSLAQIRAGFASNWRNHLRQAEAKNLTTRHATDSASFRQFEQLFTSFVARKELSVPLGATFYSRVKRGSGAGDGLSVAIAEDRGQPLAGIMLSILGDTCVYLLGATEEAALKAKAAYLLQWSAIQRAREFGVRWYDLGGIDPINNPGVYDFKKGMGGGDVVATGPYEVTAQDGWSRLTRRLESVYRHLKR
jgi:hypothetical protein